MTDNNKDIVTNNAQTAQVTNTIQKVADGLGYMLMWVSSSIRLTPTQLQDFSKAAGLPQDITDSFENNSVKASVGRAISDRKTKSLTYNDNRVEVKVLNEDNNGNLTIEFLGYETEGDKTTKRGKRTHLDKVVVGSDRSWLFKGNGNYDECVLPFIERVNYHLDHLGGNDVYEKVTNPMLKELRAVRVTRNNYYVSQTDRNNARIECLDKFFNSIGYTLICLTQAIDTRTRDGISEQVSNTLKERLEGIQDKVTEWKSKNRVHGRSSETVLRELGDILVDTENLESNLGVTLKALKDTITTVKQEANGILDGQAPTGVLPAVFNDMKSLVSDSSKIQETTNNGNVYLFQVSEFGDYAKGTGLQASADRALNVLGYYSYVSQGYVILRPVQELKAS
jgi:hypothetical protein